MIMTLFYGALYSQSNSSNLQRSTLQETMIEVDRVFAGREQVEGYPKYKHFARWAYWWSSRVNADGTFPNVDFLNKKALREWEKENKANTRGTTANWYFRGPEISTYANNGSSCKGNGYGRVDRLSFHPNDPDKIYVCTPGGGAWYTDDGGDSWECLTHSLPIIGCAGLVVDPDDPAILYLLSGAADDALNGFLQQEAYSLFSAGIYKSYDHGENWELIYDMDSLGQNVQAMRLKMHPLDSNVLFAATSQGVVRSENKGDSWQPVLAPNYVTDIEFHPTDVDRIYVSGFFGYSYSDDGGDSWNLPQGFIPCLANGNINPRVEIAVSPHAPNSVWLISGPYQNDANSFCGFYKSTNSGENFQLLTNQRSILQSPGRADQTNYDFAIAISPTDSLRGYLAVQTIFSNTNIDGNILNWNEITSFWEPTGAQKGTLPTEYVHPDIHDVAINPLDNKLYSACDGGVFVSVDNGQNWSNITKGIHNAQIYNLNLSPTDNDHFGIGLQDNGAKVKNAPNTLDILHVGQADGFDVVFDPNNTNRIVYSVNGGVRYWPDFNNDASFNANAGGNNQFFKPIRFTPNNSNQFYSGGQPLQIHTINPDNSVSLVNSNSINASATWEIETCIEEPNMVFTAGGFDLFNDPNGSFYVSADGGTNFDNKNDVFGFPANLSKITDITTYPGDCDKVAFSCGGYIDGAKIYYSENQGDQEWINISYNLPNLPVHAIEIGSDGRFYAGTEIGVFMKEEDSMEWIPFTNNLPRVPITDLEIKNDNTTIFASTFGRGVWETPLPTICVNWMVLEGDLEGSRFYEASNGIISSNEIKGGEGTEVHFHSGDHIVLQPGFSTTQFSKFFGKIAECGTGVD